MTERYRVRGALDDTATSLQQSKDTSCSQTTWTTTGSQFLFATGEKRIMYDRVIPGFHRRSKRGEMFFNPMHSEIHEAVRQAGNGPERTQVSTTINCSGVLKSPMTRDLGNQVENLYSVAVGQGLTRGRLPPLRDLVSGSEISDLIIETSTKVRNNRGRGNGNSYESLAEADKAFGTLTGIFKSTAGTLAGLAKSQKLGVIRDASSAYLAWRYGIKPMISDTQRVLDGLKKKVGRSRVTTRSTSTILREENRKVTFQSSGFVVDISETSFDHVTIRAMSLDEHDISMLNNIGFSSKDLVTLPWELLSRSFIYDWFFNIGDFIGAITPAFGWTAIGSGYTIKREQQNLIGALSTTPGTGYVINVPCSGGFSYRRTMRDRIPGLPDPRIVVKNDFRFTNGTRCLDALAIVAQKAAPFLGKSAAQFKRTNWRAYTN